MTVRVPRVGEIWRRYDGVEVLIMVCAGDRGGAYVRVRAHGATRTPRVALEQFARGGNRAWRYLRDA